MINYKIISERVDIIDVAERYGVEVNGRNKALCPFHSEKTASMSFYRNRFKCFGCGVSGDVVDFTAKLHGISGPDAAATLNKDFGLNLDLSAPASTATISAYILKKRRIEAFRKWELKLFITLCDERHRIDNIIRRYGKTLCPADEPPKEFTDALGKISITDHYINALTFMPEAEKIVWCMENKREVERIAGITTRIT